VIKTSKEFLYEQYWNQEKSIREIAQELDMSYSGIQYRLRKFKIKRRTHSEANSIAKKGNKNPMWGNLKPNAKYNAIHDYIRRHKPKPKFCEICGLPGKLELSCKDHKYTRRLGDYQYVHHRCHMNYDKRFRK
jgi:hypothetical protein